MSKTYKADSFSEEQVKKLYSVAEPLSKYRKIFDNKILVDTSGFVPLNVRIKQMLLSGEQAKINAEMFDSDDWRYMFDHVQGNSLEVGDDIEDVATKLSLIVQKRNELLQRKGLQEQAVKEQEAVSADRASESEAKAGEESAE